MTAKKAGYQLKGLEMDEHLERLRLEVEEERRRLYLERFGNLAGPKEKETSLKEFSNN